MSDFFRCIRRGAIAGAGLRTLLLVAGYTAAAQAAPPPGVFRGNYFEIEHVGYVQLCDSHDRLKVGAGATGVELSTIYAVLARSEVRQLFVEVHGHRRGAMLTLNELERVQADGPGCKEVMRNTLFKAYGSQPAWNLYIDPTGLRLRTLQDGGPIRFPYHKYWRKGGAWVFDSRNAGGDLHAELRRGRCLDPVSGGRFGFTADVSYGDKHYSGCAYPGNLFR